MTVRTWEECVDWLVDTTGVLDPDVTQLEKTHSRKETEIISVHLRASPA